MTGSNQSKVNDDTFLNSGSTSPDFRISSLVRCAMSLRCVQLIHCLVSTYCLSASQKAKISKHSL